MIKLKNKIVALITAGIVIIISGVAPNVASASQITSDCLSVAENNADEDTIDTYVTDTCKGEIGMIRSENSGQFLVYYGWNKVHRNKSYATSSADWKVIVRENRIVLEDMNDTIILQTSNNTNHNEPMAIDDLFPTKWRYDGSIKGDTATQINNLVQLTALLAGIAGGAAVSAVAGIASWIISNNVKHIYYVKNIYLRSYDACTLQEYTTTWYYQYSNYTGLIDFARSPIHDTYLC